MRGEPSGLQGSRRRRGETGVIIRGIRGKEKERPTRISSLKHGERKKAPDQTFSSRSDHWMLGRTKARRCKEIREKKKKKKKRQKNDNLIFKRPKKPNT